MTIWELLGFAAICMGLAVICMLFGAWITFKSTRAVPGEGFVGGVPKGKVFTIGDDVEIAESPASVLKKTEEFLKVLGGDR